MWQQKVLHCRVDTSNWFKVVDSYDLENCHIINVITASVTADKTSA